MPKIHPNIKDRQVEEIEKLRVEYEVSISHIVRKALDFFFEKIRKEKEGEDKP